MPCDPVRGLSPHDGPAKEPRRLESRVAAVRRSPDRRAGVSGITMPWRSIEDVAPTDGPSGNWPLPTEETNDGGAAAREGHVARNEFRPAATDPDARRNQMRFLCLKLIRVSWFLFVRPTRRFSRGGS